MTAESTILPNDDAAEFAARLKRLNDDLRPRNEVETMLIESIARDRWLSLRADRALAAEVATQLRHQPIEQARIDREAAIELGQLLLSSVPFPDGCDRLVDSESGREARLDGPGEVNHPARLVLRLEDTVAGCDWLLGQWAQLDARLDSPDLWLMEQGLEMIRLMGKQATDVIRDFEAGYVLLATECLADDTKRKADLKDAEAERIIAESEGREPISERDALMYERLNRDVRDKYFDDVRWLCARYARDLEQTPLGA